MILYFCHIQCIPLQQVSKICAARGKTFLNLVEDTCRYTLEFLGPNFLSNSQSYVFMKFTSLELLTLFLKLAKVVPKREIPSYVCLQGKNHFDSGDLHLYVLVPKILGIHFSDWKKTLSYEAHAFKSPYSPIQTALYMEIGSARCQIYNFSGKP